VAALLLHCANQCTHRIMKPWRAPRHVEVEVLAAEQTHPVRSIVLLLFLQKQNLYACAQPGIPSQRRRSRPVAALPRDEEWCSATSADAGRSSPAPRTHITAPLLVRRS
jgi:hypothetical protein